MPLKNRNSSAAAGVITIHTPTPLHLLKSPVTVPGGVWKDVSASTSEGRRTPYPRSVRGRNASQGCGAGKRNEAWLPGPPRGAWVDWLSHTSFRRLQAKLENENQEVRAITQPLLDTENGFVRDLERFLSHRETGELRKRELLHKRWTERVWAPTQRSVENHVFNCCYQEAERIRTMFMHYIHYCNTKGFVFLENYDPQEYNPFLHINRPHYVKVTTPALRDPLFLQSRERMKEKRAVLRCQTGRMYTRRQVEELLRHDLPHLTPPTDPTTPQTYLRSADLPLLATPTNRGSTSRDPLVEVETDLRRPGRASVTPYQITATAAPDGRCLQTGCWSSRG